MKTALSLLAILLLALPAASQELPTPTAQHAWLEKLAGEWETFLRWDGPDGEVELRGSATGRMIGGYWVTLESRGEIMGSAYAGLLTVGFDPEAEQYIATSVDSYSSRLVHYTGSADGATLTLETERPSESERGTETAARETIELKGDDVFEVRSMMLEGAEWVEVVTVTYTRKKAPAELAPPE